MRRFRLRSERGAELVEFALSMPILIVVIFAIAEFGILFQRYQVITNAAREAARVRILPGYTDADATARVNSYLTASGVPGSASTVVTPVNITAPSGAVIATLKVTVTYTYPMGILSRVIGLIGGSQGPLQLRGVASMRTEAASS